MKKTNLYLEALFILSLIAFIIIKLFYPTLFNNIADPPASGKWSNFQSIVTIIFFLAGFITMELIWSRNRKRMKKWREEHRNKQHER